MSHSYPPAHSATKGLHLPGFHWKGAVKGAQLRDSFLRRVQEAGGTAAVSNRSARQHLGRTAVGGSPIHQFNYGEGMVGVSGGNGLAELAMSYARAGKFKATQVDMGGRAYADPHGNRMVVYAKSSRVLFGGKMGSREKVAWQRTKKGAFVHKSASGKKVYKKK